LLKFHDVDVRHIHRDGTCEPHRDAEERMLARWGNGGDLFQSREQRLDAAYRLQSRKMGVPA
jgi:hypothetical protein